MKSLSISLIIVMAFVLTPAILNAQTDQTTTSPPVSQPLIREGTLAVKLADVFKLGTAANEAEAESILSGAGVEPRNGWIADYPVTPDIVGELQTAVSEAAESGKIAGGKESALKTFQDVINEDNLSVKGDTSGRGDEEASPPNYPDSAVINNYYYNEGPPVVTYYAPPPDYAYLYTWVPYPFWWWDFWFPGFFVLVDFDVRVHRHGHGHEHGEHFSNHFRDPRTGRMSRIDPANRSHGGTLPDRGGTGWSRPSARSGAQGILNTSRASANRGRTGAREEFRGYGERPSTGTRSSAFEHSGNSQSERAASDRGFQSRSNAGQVGGAGGSRSGGGIGFHGGGGGFHGGARH